MWQGLPLCRYCGQHVVQCSGCLHANEALVYVRRCLLVGDPIIVPDGLVSVESIVPAYMGVYCMRVVHCSQLLCCRSISDMS